MSRINILSPELISKIAAGEVIERPASVIKELLENSIDAQADNISLGIKDGGKTFIQIRDNGAGIDKEDIEKIFLRHSTSKITTLDDLTNAHSFGFRGEALYSIAAVSEVTVDTRTEAAESGWQIVQRAQQQSDIRPLAIQQGTTVTVKDIFFNTPARKKFLKNETAESAKILEVFLPYVLLYPDKTFIFTKNNRTVFHHNAGDSDLQRISRALNISSAEIIYSHRVLPHPELNCHMYLGSQNIRRSKRDMQYIFVNDRPVTHKNISYLLNQTYRKLMPDSTHPFYMLKIYMPPRDIDINIHPSKREVKLDQEHTIVSTINAWVKQAIDERAPARQMSYSRSFSELPAAVSIDTAERTCNNMTRINKPANLSLFETYRHMHDTISEPNDQFPDYYSSSDDSLRGKLRNVQYIGSFMKKYLIFESGSVLLLIDQHAAHERINYETLIDSYNNNNVEIQHLLTPAAVSLSPEEILILEEKPGILNSAGFTTTMWSDNVLAVHSCPVQTKDPETAVRSVLSRKTDLNNYESLARAACRMSIMSGDTVSKEQAKDLIKQLNKCITPFTCPHGRPTVVQIDEKTIANYFLR